MDISALVEQCAPHVHPHTMQEIIRVESQGDPLAININGLKRKPPKMKTAAEAASVARRYIARGYSVDLGIAQINSRNLGWLGLTVENALDPCTNIRAGATIIADAYARAPQTPGDEQAALKAALSAYNTGSYHRGFLNGYVARYYPQDPLLTVQTVERPPEDMMAEYARQIESVMSHATAGDAGT